MKVLAVMSAVMIMIGANALEANHCCGSAHAEEKGKTVSLPEGKKIVINSDYYFTYSFDKKPAIGTVIIKLQVFDKSGKQVNQVNVFKISAESGMPSMKGAHDAKSDFMLNKKGDYLFPVNIVMRGDWAVQISIKQKDKEIFSGVVEFNV